MGENEATPPLARSAIFRDRRVARSSGIDAYRDLFGDRGARRRWPRRLPRPCDDDAQCRHRRIAMTTDTSTRSIALDAAIEADPTFVDTLGERRIALVQATWHRAIVDQAASAFLEELDRLGIPATYVDRFEVPGSLEIPLECKLLARSGRYAVIVAAGLIVDGGIYRHEFVAETVLDAMMRVQLETEVPILSVVLTPQHFHEHEDHQRFFHEHFKIKGAEAARACTQTLANLARLAG
jgi:6,7-dimethyl-8-ribityllumazine synthase